MKRYKRAVRGMMMAMMMLIVISVPLCAYASENVPVTVDIPLTYMVNGNEDTAGGDCFTLIPDTEETPMPDGKIGGIKTIEVTKEGVSYFGEITYERPDIYLYTIERELTKRKGVTKDNTEYKVKVIALNNGEGYIIVTAGSNKDKTELVYSDQVAPETGDNTMLWAYGVLFAVAFGSIFAIAIKAYIKKRRQAKEDNEMFI